MNCLVFRTYAYLPTTLYYRNDKAKSDRGDRDILYPDLPLEGVKAEAILRGTDPIADKDTAAATAGVVEEEKVREEKEIQHHCQQLQQESALKGAGTSDSGSSTPSSSGGEEEERVAGDYGDEDDLWTDREVKMLVISFVSARIALRLQLSNLIILTLVFCLLLCLFHFVRWRRWQPSCCALSQTQLLSFPLQLAVMPGTIAWEVQEKM